MKKSMKKELFKDIIAVAVIIGGIAFARNALENYETQRKAEERALVDNYVYCLDNNWTQRDYCARGVGKSYQYMDSLIEKYGYTYEQRGKDLYLIKPDPSNS